VLGVWPSIERRLTSLFLIYFAIVASQSRRMVCASMEIGEPRRRPVGREAVQRSFATPRAGVAMRDGDPALAGSVGMLPPPPPTDPDVLISKHPVPHEGASLRAV
jgi:hypothetical protein